MILQPARRLNAIESQCDREDERTARMSETEELAEHIADELAENVLDNEELGPDIFLEMTEARGPADPPFDAEALSIIRKIRDSRVKTEWQREALYASLGRVIDRWADWYIERWIQREAKERAEAR